MFEQELYETQPAIQETESTELFHNYEIKSWEFTPRVYKILAGSAIFNILALVLIAQSNLLTMKGCESPFVGRVCQVLDTVYVGAVLFGTDRDYVDVAYDRVEFADSDITFIDVSGVMPPLSYPEGYFQIANPEQYAMMREQAENPTSGFTAFNNSDLVNIPQRLPARNPRVVQGDAPRSSLVIEDDDPPRARTPRRPRTGNDNGTEEGDELADARPNDPTTTIDPTNPVTELEINRKPLNDFADTILVKWAANEVELDETFKVVLDGYLLPDGKLDPKRSVWDVTKQEGDERMIEIAKQSVQALSQSGWLGYLRNLNVERINFVLIQDADNVTAVITSSQRSPEMARKVASGMRGWIGIGKSGTKEGSDEWTLLNAASVDDRGSTFILNFALPKPVAQEMINRRLEEAHARQKQQPASNSTGRAVSGSNTAVR
jgi:hypothetical protein